MKRLFHFNIKKNILVLMMIVCLCPILSVSYATFVFNTEEYRASEMYIGKLLYGIKINNEAVSEITISPGSHEIIVEVTSLNTISTNYKLVYETNDNIVVRYANDENTPTYGLITTTKSSTLLVTNTSEEDITVKFNIVGGYKTNELSEITIPESYSEILTDYTKYDFNTISMFVGNESVEELDSEKIYKLVDYSCTNNETVKYDSATNFIGINGFNKKTKCTLYFEDISNTLYARILLDNEESSDKDIDFSQISSDTNGKGLYYTSDLSLTEDYDGDGAGERVYYYRGAVENNYLYFANYCWRIIRTNENDSIRLRFGGSGTVGSDGKVTCPVTGTTVNIGTGIQYNANYNNAKYLGYTYDGGESNVKTQLDSWYASNIANKTVEVTNLISNAGYCNDRSNPTKPTSGTLTAYTFYGAANRLINYNAYNGSWGGTKSNAHPQYKCPQDSDLYTLRENAGGTNGYGNEILTYPIGLLTADEVSYAGGEWYNVDKSSENNTYYLYTGEYYWTMSPSYFSGSHASVLYVTSNGHLHSDSVGSVRSESVSLVPVISIKNSAIVESGSGLQTGAYVIK